MTAFQRILAGTLLSAAFFASQALAAPVTLDLDFTGFAHGSRNGTITDDGSGTGVSAGLFRFDVSNTQGASPIVWNSTLDAFCVQTDTRLRSSNTSYSLHTADSYFGNATQVDQIGRLYTGFHTSVTDGRSSAAFQLALWELVNEDTASMDLQAGSFTSTAFDTARSTASLWLGSLASLTNGFDLFVLKSDLSQDLLVFKPTPPSKVSEPGTLALLCLGLAAIGLRMRNKP